MKPWSGRREGERLPRSFWLILWAALGLSLAAQVLVHLHGYFGFDEWFGFHAAWGFLTCVGMVLGAKLLGVVLKRREDYYDHE